jgi:uncharacterized membrane protein YhaH (DUF805 family)
VNNTPTHWSLYTSLQGRIPRKTFWLKFLLPTWILSFLSRVLDQAFGISNPTFDMGPIGAFVGLVVLWPGTVGWIKRLHDRDVSGDRIFALWSLLVAFGLGALVYMVYQGVESDTLPTGIGLGLFLWLAYAFYLLIPAAFFRGTAGSNRYGENPLRDSGD